MSEESILKTESRTQPDARPWTDHKWEKTGNNNSERISRSPVEVRPLSDANDRELDSQNSQHPLPASRSHSASKITSQSAHHHRPIPTTPASTRDFAEQADLSSHQSSVHASPEICDPKIASIIYPTPSNKEWTTPRKKKIPTLSCFPCFERRRKNECWIENKRRSFWSSEAKEQERLREEAAWEKVKEGRYGKSALERQLEWQNSLRRYEECSMWQQNVGKDTRRRHQTKLIKAVVRERPISDIQELRSDAIMMESELFGTSEDLDEYSNKTREIVKVLDAKRELQREKEILEAEKKDNWEGLVLSLTKLKEFLPKSTSSLSQFWGGEESPSSIESVEATPCNCRDNEGMSMCSLQDERTSSGQEDSGIQDEVNVDRHKGAIEKQNEVALTRPRNFIHKPNLQKIHPAYIDKNSVFGWSHKPPEDPEASWHDDDEDRSSPRPHNSFYARRCHGRSTKAQIKADGELDDDEWSIIDRESSPILTKIFKCFR